MQYILVDEEGMIVKYPLSTFCQLSPFPAPPARGSFQEEEVKQPHWKYTKKRPNIMYYVVPPEAPDHLPLASLPCLHVSEATVERTSQEGLAVRNTC